MVAPSTAPGARTPCAHGSTEVSMVMWEAVVDGNCASACSNTTPLAATRSIAAVVHAEREVQALVGQSRHGVEDDPRRWDRPGPHREQDAAAVLRRLEAKRHRAGREGDEHAPRLRRRPECREAAEDPLEQP